MANKSKILEALGGGRSDLLLPEKVTRALQANDRVKYLLTLLQQAQAQARSPVPAPEDLSIERRRAGLEDAGLDQVVPQAAMTRDGRLDVPAAGRILSLAFAETARMCDPLAAVRRPEAAELTERVQRVWGICLETLDGTVPAFLTSGTASDPSRPSCDAQALDGAALTLPPHLVDRLSSANRSGEDSLHLIVMDAHKALNALIAEMSATRERIGDVDALGLAPEDRALVEAFAEGVRSTRRLKGTHPGLSTTAVRAGKRLLIQNDIGETDAHVVLVEVEAGRVEVTYTDVHEKRVAFFARILAGLPISWKRTETRSSSEFEEGGYILLRGSMEAMDPAAAAEALRRIGSVLVFLIDWNKARKRIRTFLPGDEAIEVLLWAVEERVGFMSFLQYGGRDLIYEALEALPSGTVRRGEPLESILGLESAVDFIKESLRAAHQGHERGEPRTLVIDKLRCWILARAKKRAGEAREMLAEMALLAVESALAFRDAFRAATRPLLGIIARSSERIQQWEERADGRLNRIRKLHLREAQPALPVAALVDDALDALEESANLTLAIEAKLLAPRKSGAASPRPLPEGSAELLQLLEEAAELVLHSSQLFFKTVRQYEALLRGRSSGALFDTLSQLKAVEQEGDRVKRSFLWKFLAQTEDSKLDLAARLIGERLEEAMNALSRAGFLIHDLAYTAMERGHAG